MGRDRRSRLPRTVEGTPTPSHLGSDPRRSTLPLTGWVSPSFNGDLGTMPHGVRTRGKKLLQARCLGLPTCGWYLVRTELGLQGCVGCSFAQIAVRTRVWCCFLGGGAFLTPHSQTSKTDMRSRIHRDGQFVACQRKQYEGPCAWLSPTSMSWTGSTFVFRHALHSEFPGLSQRSA